jgi:hypothetical protein
MTEEGSPNSDYKPMDPGEITPEMAAQLEEARKLTWVCLETGETISPPQELTQ